MADILNFKVVVEQDEDGIFVASVPSVPGCYSQGLTYEEALTNIKEALELCLEEAKENQNYADKITFPNKSGKDNFFGIVSIPMRFSL